MSQISRLPDDVLYFVFLHTLPSVIDSTDLQISRISPANLSLVCRSWHKIVVSTPSLWCSIEIYLGGPGSKSSLDESPEIQQMLDGWLKNSESSLLDIYLHFWISDEGWTGLLEAISSQHHRLRTINVRVSEVEVEENEILDPGNPIVFRYSPTLTSINVTYDSYSDMLSVISLDLTSIVNHPGSQLRALALSPNVPWHLPTGEIGTPFFPTLEEINIGIVGHRPLFDIYTLLSWCPNIVFVSLSDETWFQEDPEGFDADAIRAVPNNRQPILLSYLRRLIIDIDSLFNLSHILNWLTCPHLITVRAHGRNLFTIEELDALAKFFKRSETRLQILQLNSDAYQLPVNLPRNELSCALEGLLLLLDDLVELQLRGAFVVSERLIEAMTLSEPGALCPRLAKLRLCCYGAGSSDAHLEAIEDMIESRWKSSSRTLRSVELQIPGLGFYKGDEEKSERMQAWIDEGLIFH